MILSLVQKAAAAWRLVRSYPRHGIRVLCYHTVIRQWVDKRVQWPIAVSIEAFERQVKHLATHYDLIGIDDIPEVLRRGPATRDRAVVMTFDDGYSSNAEMAWPVLKAQSIPMAIFVTTEYLSGERRLPTFIVRCSVFHTQERRLRASGREWSLETDAQRERCVEDVMVLLRQSRRADMERLLDEVRVLLSDDEWREWTAKYDSDRLLTWGQVEKLYREGVTIGSHTHSHVMMSACATDGEVAGELGHSKALLAGRGIRCSSFAYPNGKRADLGPDTPRHLERLGYTTAFTTIAGRINSMRHRYLLPRLSGQHENMDSFLNMLKADWRALLKQEILQRVRGRAW